jgi:hypothetical protein
MFGCGNDQDCAAKCQDSADPAALATLKALDDCAAKHAKDADCKF